MPRTTRLTVSDSARVSNIRKAGEVEVCDFFLNTDQLLQRVDAPEGETVSAYDVTTATVIQIPADQEVDLVEEISIQFIND